MRLADILDFDGSRTPPKLYNVLSLSGFSNDEWLQHFVISNQNKIIENNNGEKVIEFHGSCSEPTIHRKILGYLDWVNKEIDYANELTRNYAAQHRLNFYHKVNNCITSEDYSIVDMKFQVNYKNIIQLFMGEALYGNKELGVRELLQNAIDACEVKKEIHNTATELAFFDDYSAKIFIFLDKKNNEVIIKDNGVGMNLTVIKNYFLEVGASYYKSDEYLLSNYEYNPIGNYGIGFLSSFMLSDKVKVRTKHINGEILYEIDIFKNDDFVSIKEKRDPQFVGTEIILNYEQFFEVWENKESLRDFIGNGFLTEDIQISIVDKDNVESITINNNPFKLESNNIIDLTPYLNGVSVKIELVQGFSDSLFKENLNDINFYGEPYFFDGENLFQIDESDKKFPIANYLNENKLGVIDFPIIEYSNELDDILNVIDSETEAEENYRDRYNPWEVSLITLPELLEMPPQGLVNTNEIVSQLTFDKFDEYYNHDNSSGTFFDFSHKLFFTTENIKKFIEIKGKEFINEGKLYVRGVLVNQVDFIIENSIRGLSIKQININVNNKKIKPNVTRNDINNNDRTLIQNSIYQALCIYLLEKLSDPKEKILLRGFIKKFHSYNETLVLEKYIKNLDV